MNYSADSNITKFYDNGSLEHQILKLEKGKIYGIASINSGDKSIILKTILKILDLNDVILIGNHLKESFKDSLKIVRGIVDFISFYEYLTAYENLRYFALLYEKPLSKVDDILFSVGLEKSKIQVKKFTKSMKQRLGLAIALLKNPQIVLLDETIDSLDINGVFELRNLLLGLENQIVIVSSNAISDLEKIVDEVLFINEKKLIQKSINRFDDESSFRVIFDNYEEPSNVLEVSMVREDEEYYASDNQDKHSISQDVDSLEDMLVSMFEDN